MSQNQIRSEKYILCAKIAFIYCEMGRPMKIIKNYYVDDTAACVEKCMGILAIKRKRTISCQNILMSTGKLCRK